MGGAEAADVDGQPSHKGNCSNIDNGGSSDRGSHSRGTGNAILRALRKLTPPKMIFPSPRSVAVGHPKACKNSPTAVSPQVDRAKKDFYQNPSSTSATTGQVANLDGDAVDGTGARFYCPALNCFQKLHLEEVLAHAQGEHSLVVSDSPESHSNSVEVDEGDLTAEQGSAAWAPTLLSAFNNSFFFETWRDAGGRWSMWVYHLGGPGDGKEYLAELEVCGGGTKVTYSGPVHSLTTPQAKITEEGICLSFSDGLARHLLKPLEDCDSEREATGICYRVKITKMKRDITRF